jgi:hypothetical protein
MHTVTRKLSVSFVRFFVRRFLGEVVTGQSGTIYFKKIITLENRNPKGKYIAEN